MEYEGGGDQIVIGALGTIPKGECRDGNWRTGCDHPN